MRLGRKQNVLSASLLNSSCMSDIASRCGSDCCCCCRNAIWSQACCCSAAHPRAAAGAQTLHPTGFVRPLQGVWSGSKLVSLRIEITEHDDMTYLGGLFNSCCVLRWDMVGIAHGEESVDRAVLAAHQVDNRMPILKLPGWPHLNVARQLWFIGYCLWRWQAIKRQQAMSCTDLSSFDV
jgi:hypothetical protein